MSIDSGDPITQTSERPSESTKNSFKTLNEIDPSSISIDLIPLCAKADSSLSLTVAGMKSRFSDRHSKNVFRSIVVSLDGRSNVTDPRHRQVEKQFAGRRRTYDGIAIDCSDSQKRNAKDPISHRKEWASNATILR
jgi:hypothetical protein